MHEMGIILHLAKTLEETAEQEKIKRITRVTLEVGRSEKRRVGKEGRSRWAPCP